MASIQKIEGKRGVRWKAVVRRRGYPTTSESFGRKTDAEKWANGVEAKIDEGRFQDQSQARRHTVGDLIDRYIAEVIPNKKAGAVQVFQLRQWQAELGLLRLSELTPDRIIKARDKLMMREGNDGPMGSSTVNRYHAALAHALTVAEKLYGWIEINPMRRVPKLKDPQGRVRYLSDIERRALLDACRNSTNPYLLPIVLIAITTGMRRGEIENLTWGDIDWKQDRIVIEEPKNGMRRSAPLLRMAKDALAPHRPDSPEARALVFPGCSGTRPIVMKKAWYSAVSEAGIEDFRFHDLRHTAASYLAMNGASIPEISAVLGHKSHQMASRYAHLSDGHTRSVVERAMGKVFGNE
ncbi:MAG TPA: site-specific integrase [Thermohalobaculum sp.]|nr:site-specific integrase [Thermohalobaculum sp.]